MSGAHPAVRLLVNAVFAAAFLVGGCGIWLGLRSFILADGAVERGPLGLAVGFAVWVALAGTVRRLAGPRREGASR